MKHRSSVQLIRNDLKKKSEMRVKLHSTDALYLTWTEAGCSLSDTVNQTWKSCVSKMSEIVFYKYQGNFKLMDFIIQQEKKKKNHSWDTFPYECNWFSEKCKAFGQHSIDKSK